MTRPVTRPMTYDAVVVGLGAFGALALWRLARRGLRVAGVERFGIAHARGSSHGHTRLFRTACLEHPELPALARVSAELWRELEAESGAELLTTTGGVMIGPPDGRAVGGTLRAAARHGLAVKALDPADVRERFGQHAGLAAHWSGVWDPEAGVLRPEAAVAAAVARARAWGAEVHDGLPVNGIERDGRRSVVRTACGDLRAEQVVVATGGWLAELVPGVVAAPVRVPLLWFRDRDGAHDLARLPVFIRHYDEEHTIWGHGGLDGLPPKVGLSPDPRHQPPVDPDHPAPVGRGDWSHLAGLLPSALPGLDPTPVRAEPCMITRSADGQFLVGRTPGRPGIVLAGGCSGHGFKHAAGVGELVARRVTGEDPQLATDYLDPARFA